MGCMLRGVTTAIESTNEKPDWLKRSGNEQVSLDKSTIPPHMHHSGITVGQKYIVSMASQSSDQSYTKKRGGVRYDVFNNDSLSGLSKNELDGTIDEFKVLEAGENDSVDKDNVCLNHNNIPDVQGYYAFVIHKNAVTA